MKDTKEARMRELLARPQGLNCFEAFNHGDTCLNTTASDLQKKGYLIVKKRETITNRFGGKNKVMRYWLIENSEEKSGNAQTTQPLSDIN